MNFSWCLRFETPVAHLVPQNNKLSGYDVMLYSYVMTTLDMLCFFYFCVFDSMYQDFEQAIPKIRTNNLVNTQRTHTNFTFQYPDNAAKLEEQHQELQQHFPPSYLLQAIAMGRNEFMKKSAKNASSP